MLSTSNIFCTFLGKLKAYALGRLQCTVNLIANLIYPEIEISTRELHVQNNLLPRAITFILHNPSDTLAASFELKFRENSMHIIPIEEKRQSSLMNIVQCLMNQKCNLREKFFHSENEDDEANFCDDFDEIENVKRKSSKIKTRTTQFEDQKNLKFSAVSENVQEIITKNYNIEATSNDIQKCFKSLMRTVSETHCCNNDEISKANSSVTALMTFECEQKYLSLSQIKGVLKEGECRLISVYFSGSEKGKKLF